MVYILLGKGFEETEAIAPGDVLRRAQIPMQYVGIGGRIVEGAHGISVQADITASEMALSEMDMLVLPGGLGGVESIEGSDEAVKAIIYALEKRGLLDGRHAVCYPGCEKEMGKAIVHPDKEAVVDGNIITGRAPGAAIEFGLTLAGMLKGEFSPDEIAGYMVYERR